MVQIYKILCIFLNRKDLSEQDWARHAKVYRNRKKQSGTSPAKGFHLGCLKCLDNSAHESLHAWLLFCFQTLLSSMPSPQRCCLCPHLQLISILVTVLGADFDRTYIIRHTVITYLCVYFILVHGLFPIFGIPGSILLIFATVSLYPGIQ